jgi:hypothetical protein
VQISKGQEIQLVASHNRTTKTTTPSKSILEKKIRNYDYLKRIAQNERSLEIDRLQREAANFNLSSLAIYDKSEKSKYDVVIRSSYSTLYIKYDYLGNIISSVERYKNLKIPLNLSQEIARKYPGWRFTKSTYSVKYRNGKPLKGKYNIHLMKRGKSKHIRFNIL